MLILISLLKNILCLTDKTEVIINLASNPLLKLHVNENNTLVAKKFSILNKFASGLGVSESRATLVPKSDNVVQIFFKGSPVAYSEYDNKIKINIASEFDPKTFFNMVESGNGTVRFENNMKCIDAGLTENTFMDNFVTLAPCNGSPSQSFEITPSGLSAGSLFSGIGSRLSGLAGGAAGFASSYRYSSSSSASSRM
ncbi:hypothetical protein TUBRATIS_003260 [Tubulinosema ratisbonensis]|uniref:Uncharacterized protein n=1 Tax=Tubulinosema ratisbonensis TaxID=291195 RepID=A0A437APP8_9MICR|nr:hypothetical protein TUBRATIS_003260 [Tubulinosema ratisbonensis]